MTDDVPTRNMGSSWWPWDDIARHEWRFRALGGAPPARAAPSAEESVRAQLARARGRPTCTVREAMTDHRLEIQPLSRHRWVVRYEGDSAPLAEQPTLEDARAEARNWARQFGETAIVVHELDGDTHIEGIDPDFRAPTPADVKGPVAEP